MAKEDYDNQIDEPLTTKEEPNENKIVTNLKIKLDTKTLNKDVNDRI